MKPSTPSRLRVNLLPADLLISRRRRRHLKRLLIVSSICLTSLALTCVVTKVATVPAADSPTVELDRLTKQTNEANESLARLRLQIRSLAIRLDARKSLADQPDFSSLLTILGTCIDGDVTVRQFQLNASGTDPLRAMSNELPRALALQPPTAPIVGAEREPKYFILSLRGTATSEAGISRFTAHLRDLQLFDAVDLKRTGRDPGSENAVAFEVSLILAESSSETSGASNIPRSPARTEGGRR